jgi:DNA-binding beta-propeller fold protein YncE
VDTTRNKLYISSPGSECISVVDVATNKITAVYGTFLTSGYSGGTASSAKLNSPYGMAVDTVNNKLYIADYVNGLIRVVDTTTNIIDTIAGDNYYGDTRAATKARLTAPQRTVVDNANNLVYIADTSVHIIRVVNRTSGIISLFAGIPGPSGGTISNAGNGGLATEAKLNSPTGMTIDTVNNLVYIADSGLHMVRVVNRTNGIISLFAGTGVSTGTPIGDGGNATQAILGAPSGVALDSKNNLIYISEALGNRVRVVNRTTNIITTFAGTGTTGSTGDYGPATAANFVGTYDVAVNSVSNIVYIADFNNGRIRYVDRSNNTIYTLVTDTSSPVYALDIDPNNNLLYYVDHNKHYVYSICVNNAAIKYTFAGTGSPGYSGDYGDAKSAKIYSPGGVSVDTVNNLVYITEITNQVVRVVNRTSIPSCPDPTPTPTPTYVPTTTPAPTPTPTPTHTYTPTNTPTPTPTYIPTTTATSTPTATPTPTPTATQTATPLPQNTTSTFVPTPTPTSQFYCFDISASDAQVCSGNGVCISTDNCQCNSPKLIGSKCEINMQVQSSTYVVFDSSSGQSSINIDAANDLPGSSGSISYSFTSDNQLQLTSSSSDTGLQGICLNPSLLVAGLQTFVAFSFPTALPSGVASEIWLQDTTSDYRVSSALQFVDGSQSLDLTADSTTSTTVSLSANVTYILLLSVSEFGSDLSAQIITLVNIDFIFKLTYFRKMNKYQLRQHQSMTQV